MSKYDIKLAKQYWNNRYLDQKNLGSVMTMNREEDNINFHKYEIKLLKTLVHGKILDLGCGLGRVGNDLYNSGFDVYGQDISNEMLKLCKFPVKEGSADKILYKDKEFDTVLCLGLLEHLPKDMRRSVLKEINRVCKKTAIILVNNPDNKELKELVQSEEQYKDGYFRKIVDCQETIKEFDNCTIRKIDYSNRLILVIIDKVKPVVSIGIPCYNRSDLLKECIESFLNQDFQDIEIVVGDDYSTENLKEVCDSFNNPKVKYFKSNRKKGIAGAHNTALFNSMGKYFIASGSDDLAYPGTISIFVDYLDRHPEFDVVYGNYLMRDMKIKDKKVEWFGQVEEAYNDERDYPRLLKKQFMPAGGSMWKREKVPEYDETLESAVDWEMYLRAMESGCKFKMLPVISMIYRLGDWQREENTDRQLKCCEEILRRRGVKYDRNTKKTTII